MTNVLDQWVKEYGLVFLMHDYTAENKSAPNYSPLIARLPFSRQDIFFMVMPYYKNHYAHNYDQGEWYQRKKSKGEKHAVSIVSQHIDHRARHQDQIDHYQCY
jgi:hypothetical protein